VCVFPSHWRLRVVSAARYVHDADILYAPVLLLPSGPLSGPSSLSSWPPWAFASLANAATPVRAGPDPTWLRPGR
jgi:hypothetical protein